MKKLLSIGLIMMLSMSLLTGCGLIDGIFGEKANGVIIYGETQQIDKAIEKHKSKISEKNTFPVKLIEAQDKKVLALSSKTAEELIKKELLKKVVKDSDTQIITSLPSIPADGAILFAKEKVSNLPINGITAKYEDNIIIGDGRSYADMFLIVDETAFAKLQGTDKSMAALKYSKNPKNEMQDLSSEVEKAQMVTMKK
ncbi:lipoprotein BA_5634 family protein [Paenibacillus sp. N1-5-1-14]|uniref:lipoprotein BA_5634 family protein n=1 Tax=Paenibacillus radicibacter TaxID=2972488 RepID=UPI002158AC90|nr:lipoprotein BA_5634 family protein [Paenibacillus radicibacter]MCR8641765.1 lipoprotein BA_5634 family protein [Paenibacillus radicibacter]